MPGRYLNWVTIVSFWTRTVPPNIDHLTTELVLFHQISITSQLNSYCSTKYRSPHNWTRTVPPNIDHLTTELVLFHQISITSQLNSYCSTKYRSPHNWTRTVPPNIDHLTTELVLFHQISIISQLNSHCSTKYRSPHNWTRAVPTNIDHLTTELVLFHQISIISQLNSIQLQHLQYRQITLKKKPDLHLLQILVTHFPANRVPRTRTASSAARKWTTHLVCGSCQRKLEHVQTRLSTRICLTQHPSDTLWLFRELNCGTS